MCVFFTRYTFGYGLLNGCLPADFYMIDHSDKTIKTGELIAFNMPKSVRFIPENERVIKIVAGVGGDKLKVTMDGVYNGDKFFEANARRISKKYSIPSILIEKELIIPGRRSFPNWANRSLMGFPFLGNSKAEFSNWENICDLLM